MPRSLAIALAGILFVSLCHAQESPAPAAPGTPAKPAEAKPFSASETIDRIITAPGKYDQMCMIPYSVKPGVPLLIYGDSICYMFHLSGENIQELYAHRAAVVDELRQRIAAIDATKDTPPWGGIKNRRKIRRVWCGGAIRD